MFPTFCLSAFNTTTHGKERSSLLRTGIWYWKGTRAITCLLQWTSRGKRSSTVQLSRMHPRFFHAGASELFNLIKRPRPEWVTSETLATLKDISKRCNLCQRIQRAPSRFCMTLGVENLRYNKSIIIYIIYINGDPILHIVDETTCFRDAILLPSVSIESILPTLLQC